ncbi:MAG: fibronectin type III domain-containing protein, partial [Gemmatimonadetes bacterium]|nr:fibronectin type III domain-containing protein [Gemmatimonadota bacterium]
MNGQSSHAPNDESPMEMNSFRISAWAFPIATLAYTILLAIPNPAEAAAVVRGPYLQSATPTSIIVRWRTDAATESRVRYGAAPGVYDSSHTDTAIVTEHEIALTGLAPGTTYYYAVGTDSIDLAGGDSTYRFRT